MHCPFCSTPDTRVIDSRLSMEGMQVRRRRECMSCGERFTTYETVELSLPRVIKSDGNRERFDESKIRRGLIKALEKRPVESDAIEQVVNRIEKQLTSEGVREIASSQIGELLMDALRELDQVAYVRFASVYRSFQDVNAFREEIEKLVAATKSR
ncbi:MAG: transcriptional regulator NrdR [Piscirickettsiaceae bacterium CG_4_9_14_3_um_filter_43_564]|nr:transcriptional regulator NrdR [Thiomicrospira sp.]OIP94750.1 MAG: transcriptional regulator NrdR [Thiomicrospira sp. CG2_30_44_34]PIQ03174.1 MAG: transcriptional regulator NrdR [Piscirickettsiaceae bacterium CG18_big_fil_WC_8_21_14_2_50_44_103]PIU39449.1 MAG: transcriptional regulator NrdR [Piscirickettsiaceae bacterium CG07_land_8_20_14_0_80_44_28]PIW58536.1 MAG: transcriptional regulator NrdR [Piscirickettsiaceae bacterium CG12_big_fil_rev_8_21_14_0_65_44_934]PIW78395.1 MAG: transcriptio